MKYFYPVKGFWGRGYKTDRRGFYWGSAHTPSHTACCLEVFVTFSCTTTQSAINLCLSFQKEPELNPTSSPKSRPSSPTSQAKDREEKASPPTSHPVFLTTFQREKCVLGLSFFFYIFVLIRSYRLPCHSQWNRTTIRRSHHHNSHAEAENPVMTASIDSYVYMNARLQYVVF